MTASRYEGGPSRSPGFLLWHTTLRWQRALTSALEPLGLTHVQFVLLACSYWLDEAKRAASQVEVARQAGTDVKMTSQVLRRLEDAGLIVRALDPDDARARIVTVTASGRRLAVSAIAVVEEADEAFFASQPASLRAALLRVR